MWLATTSGFYSVVEHRDDPQLLMVRTRVRGDLNALRPFLPRMRVQSTPSGDYPFRTVVTRREWAHVLERLTVELDYDDFKRAVEARQGRKRHDIYLSVWSILHRLEPVRARVERMGKELSWRGGDG